MKERIFEYHSESGQKQVTLFATTELGDHNSDPLLVIVSTPDMLKADTLPNMKRRIRAGLIDNKRASEWCVRKINALLMDLV